MIESKHLQLILAIDKLGSLNKASKELHLTQSALSHQLKKLETHLDIEIFHRIGNQLFFTEAGKELRDRAKQILAEFSSLEARMREIKEHQLERYIHGYSQREAQRLVDQATSVAQFLHHDSLWEEGARILEVGCGVGAQTTIIAPQNPNCQFVSVDISAPSLAVARATLEDQNIQNVALKLADARDLKVGKEGLFDHIFICFLLEHLSHPIDLIKQLKSLLKEGGTITIIEGDHGSTFFYPDNLKAQKVVKAQVALQQKRGGNANIGRALYPLLQEAGYKNITVSPRQIYVDGSKPTLVEGFIKNTFTAMIQGMSEDLLQEQLVSISELQEGINGLLRTAEVDGVFSYTFFKAKGLKVG